jgi:hypothetical protein
MEANKAGKVESLAGEISVRLDAVRTLENYRRDLMHHSDHQARSNSASPESKLEARESYRQAEFHAINAETKPVMLADRSAGKEYGGVVVGRSETHIVQWDAKSNQYNVHENKLLNSDTAQFVNKDVSIRYPFGGAGLIKEAGPTLDKGLSAHQLMKDQKSGELQR